MPLQALRGAFEGRQCAYMLLYRSRALGPLPTLPPALPPASAPVPAAAAAAAADAAGAAGAPAPAPAAEGAQGGPPLGAPDRPIVPQLWRASMEAANQRLREARVAHERGLKAMAVEVRPPTWRTLASSARCRARYPSPL